MLIKNMGIDIALLDARPVKRTLTSNHNWEIMAKQARRDFKEYSQRGYDCGNENFNRKCNETD